jgi:hypothetical protein
MTIRLSNEVWSCAHQFTADEAAWVAEGNLVS